MASFQCIYHTCQPARLFVNHPRDAPASDDINGLQWPTSTVKPTCQQPEPRGSFSPRTGWVRRTPQSTGRCHIRRRYHSKRISVGFVPAKTPQADGIERRTLPIPSMTMSDRSTPRIVIRTLHLSQGPVKWIEAVYDLSSVSYS